MHINKILNHIHPKPTDLRLGHFIQHGWGDVVIVNAIAATALEVLPIGSIQYTIIAAENIRGIPITGPSGSTYAEHLLLDNGFIMTSAYQAVRHFPDGSIMDIIMDAGTQRWRITYADSSIIAYYVSDFQDIYRMLTGQELATRGYPPYIPQQSEAYYYEPRS